MSRPHRTLFLLMALVVLTTAVSSQDQPGGAAIPAMRRDQSGSVTRSRPLCACPLVAKYKGSGSTDQAANFSCSTGF